MVKKIIGSTEAEEMIWNGKGNFVDTIIRGGLHLEDIALGKLNFVRTTIEGHIQMTRVTINGDLCFAGAIIKAYVDLQGITIKGDLDLSSAIIESTLHLNNTTIEGNMDLSLRKGPSKIYVYSEMAQLVHWAAPNTPLVVQKK